MVSDYINRENEELVRAAVASHVRFMKDAEHTKVMFQELGKTLGRGAFIYDADVVEFEKLMSRTGDYGDLLHFAGSVKIKSHQKSLFRMLLGAAVDLKRTKEELASATESKNRLYANLDYLRDFIFRVVAKDSTLTLCDVCDGERTYFCENCRGLGYVEQKDDE